MEKNKETEKPEPASIIKELLASNWLVANAGGLTSSRICALMNAKWW